MLPATPVYLGQATCPIGAPPGTCGEGVDRPQATRYADLILKTISENPQCFEGEDLTLAYALEGKLRSFGTSFPSAFGKQASVLTLSSDDNRVIQQASGCRIVTMTQPGPNTSQGTQQSNDLRQPIQIQQPGSIIAEPDSSQSNLVPVAIGAAGALALIYALIH